jgi:hypothetical protein
MIVVVGQYPIISLEMGIGILYGHPQIAQRVISHGRRALGRGGTQIDYGIVAKGCHTWPIRGSAYIVLVRFIPLHDWLLIQIFMILSDMSDILFTAPTRRNAYLLL